ncbi:GLIPR1-like protein 1 [Megalops cyprinoides]|uniref:GLIPR1-like protein 1 n=1 Tax=Megalops cyprinoides TaxID=118141 RepID=UPI001864D7DE|nr:GLIPR1-like protein 1 [Megalops cyprinoides]
MDQLLHMPLWLALFMDLTVHIQSSKDTQLPDITDQDFINKCVKAHNHHRSSVKPAASNMFYMTWDEAIAKTARAWARFCKFDHNPRLKTKGEVHPNFTSLGENIWVGTPYSIFTVEKAIQSWYDEVAHYDYYSMSCNDVCGHYTQVVWATSYKVGCAVQACHEGVEGFYKGPAAIFVCDYGDAGNYGGVHPYKTGSPCSGCNGGTCENNLCRDPKRDALKRYNWSPAWDPAASSCGSYCLGVLVTRPLAVLLTFIGVYGLQILYPNMFAYE